MATTIRRLIIGLGWLLLAMIISLPVIGVLIGIWPGRFASVDALIDNLPLFLNYNGLGPSILYSMLASLVAPLVGFYVAFSVYTQYRFRPSWQTMERRLAPFLSLPHLAVALGLVYLFSAGGLIELGLGRKSITTLILAITVKEVPFFLFVISAIDRQIPVKKWLLQGRALGYSESASWWLLVFPLVLKQSKLALFAAMAYTLSVLDVSLLVGPNIPSVFSVLVYQWQTGFSERDLSFAFWANLTLIIMLGVSIFCLYIHQWISIRLFRYLAVMASPLVMLSKLSRLALAWFPLFSALSLGIILLFLLRSVGFWSGETYSLTLWQEEWLFVQQPLFNSLYTGLASGLIGIICALIALELQRQYRYFFADYIWLAAILLPQLSVVYGWQLAHTWINGSYSLFWVLVSHIPFVFAYSYLVLKGPFQSLGDEFELVARSFGYSYWQGWWRIRFMLLRPAILSAFAIGFSVSIAQYIPTLMIGAGRFPSITTEAVAIASGRDLNLTSLYMLLQSGLPMLIFIVAILFASRIHGKSHAIS